MILKKFLSLHQDAWNYIQSLKEMNSLSKDLNKEQFSTIEWFLRKTKCIWMWELLLILTAKFLRLKNLMIFSSKTNCSKREFPCLLTPFLEDQIKFLWIIFYQQKVHLMKKSSLDLKEPLITDELCLKISVLWELQL